MARIVARRRAAAALRLRLDPHFLFNTLNGISAMIVTRRLAEADEMVNRLSTFLRAALAGPDAAEVALGKELRLVEDYAWIERHRFGARLEVAIDCAPAAATATMPPLLILHLVERTVAAASRTATPVRIRVTAQRRGGRVAVTIAHPCVAFAAPDLAAARAWMSGYADARLVAVPGATRVWLRAGSGAE